MFVANDILELWKNKHLNRSSMSLS
jgi:hypothetical protein